jgi:predicted MFS family arabinose efflux permease
LELALWGGWSSSFFATGAAGLLIALLISLLLSPQAVAPSSLFTLPQALADFIAVARQRPVQIGLIAMSALIASNMLLIPNMASFMSFNLAYPVESLGLLWMAGGAAGLIGGNVAGRFADRLGAVRTLWVSSICLSGTILTIWFLYRPAWPMMPAFAIFVMLNIAGSAVVNARLSRLPPAEQRGRFAALMVTVQHATTASCALIASTILTTGSSGQVVGMEALALAAVICALAVPLLITYVDRITSGLSTPRSTCPPRCLTPRPETSR